MTNLSQSSSGISPEVRSVIREDPVAELRYRAYRQRQARALVSLIPPEIIRPLYASARDWAQRRGQEVGKDPLATFLLFLESLLPLPPLDVWMEDRARNLSEHLHEELEGVEIHDSRSIPMRVDSRPVELGGERWRATLHLFRRAEAWRGYILFNQGDEREGVRTADIFREENPEEVRQRFLDCRSETLQAFLRSVLP
ncbi:hypothetical protein ACFL3S_08000 [Gemmatimonadota bacterium]